MWASVFHTFCPLTIHSSPSLIARVSEPGEVRSRPRLRKQLTPHLLAGEHRTQESFLHRLVAVGHDRRPGQRHEELSRVGGPGRRRRPRRRFTTRCSWGRHAEPAVAFGKLHPRQPGVELVAAELMIALGLWIVLGQPAHPVPPPPCSRPCPASRPRRGPGSDQSCRQCVPYIVGCANRSGGWRAREHGLAVYAAGVSPPISPQSQPPGVAGRRTGRRCDPRDGMGSGDDRPVDGGSVVSATGRGVTTGR